jgi:hypothetical protein
MQLLGFPSSALLHPCAPAPDRSTMLCSYPGQFCKKLLDETSANNAVNRSEPFWTEREGMVSGPLVSAPASFVARAFNHLNHPAL